MVLCVHLFSFAVSFDAEMPLVRRQEVGLHLLLLLKSYTKYRINGVALDYSNCSISPLTIHVERSDLNYMENLANYEQRKS